MVGKTAHWHNHLSRVLSPSCALLTTTASKLLVNFTRNCSCSAYSEGRDGLAVLGSILTSWKAWETLHAKGKITNTEDSNLSAMAPAFIHQNLRAFKIGPFLNLLKGWPIFQTGMSVQVTHAAWWFRPIGNFGQITEHFSILVITTATFSFSKSPSSWYHKILPVGDLGSFPLHKLEMEGCAGPKSIGVGRQKNSQQHTSFSVIDFCVFKLSRNYWCYVHLHPIWKIKSQCYVRLTSRWCCHMKDSECPLLTRDGQSRKLLLNFWKRPKETDAFTSLWFLFQLYRSVT